MGNISTGRQTLILKVMPQHLWKLLFILAGTNICVLSGAVFFEIYYHQNLDGNWDSGSFLKYILVQFSLSREHTISVWYSSVLLLLVSLMAGLCFLAERQTKEKHQSIFHYGWLAYVGVFGVLSLDEIGSLHERIGNLHALNPFGDYALGWSKLLLPMIAVVAVLMLVFSWVHLRRSRMTLALMILGVLLFLSIPFQEQLEMAMFKASGPDWTRPIPFLLLEEGAELFGILFFLAAMIYYFICFASNNKNIAVETRNIIMLPVKMQSIVLTIFATSLGLFLMMIAFNALQWHYQPGKNGIPQNWFPCALSFWAACIAYQFKFLRDYKSFWSCQLYKTLIAFSIVLSAYYGSAMKGWLSSAFFRINHTDKLIHGLLIAVAVAIASMMISHVSSKAEKLCWAGWIVALSLSMKFGIRYVASPIDLVAMGILLYACAIHLHEGQMRQKPFIETTITETGIVDV